MAKKNRSLEKDTPTDDPKQDPKNSSSKKPYHPPSMKKLGELKDITLAGTNTTVT